MIVVSKLNLFKKLREIFMGSAQTAEEPQVAEERSIEEIDLDSIDPETLSPDDQIVLKILKRNAELARGEGLKELQEEMRQDAERAEKDFDEIQATLCTMKVVHS